MVKTFGLSTVVICLLCTSDMFPPGSKIKLFIDSNLLQASIAAEPVSPDVAPKTIAVLLCFVKVLLKNAAAS